MKDLERCFEQEEIVNRESLRLKGLISGRKNILIKILSNGTLSKKLTISAHAWSKTAQDAIQNVGGEIKQIEESCSGSIAA